MDNNKKEKQTTTRRDFIKDAFNSLIDVSDKMAEGVSKTRDGINIVNNINKKRKRNMEHFNNNPLINKIRNNKDFKNLFSKDLSDIQKTVDSMINESFGSQGVFTQETKEKKEIMFLIPGFSLKDISVEIDGDNLMVTSNEEAEERLIDMPFKNSISYELNMSSFIESYNIDGVTASVTNGILTVVLPKKKNTKKVII